MRRDGRLKFWAAVNKVLEVALIIGAGFGVWWYLRGRGGSRVSAYPVPERAGVSGVDVVDTGFQDLDTLYIDVQHRYSDTRGFRNNNPGNIEYTAANQWVGQAGSDGRYVVFIDVRFGLRAIGKLLDTYRDRYGLNTIRGIIGRWAPPSENDTNSYVSSVSGYMGVGPDVLLSGDWVPLVAAIVRHENGVNPFDDAFIREALAL